MGVTLRLTVICWGFLVPLWLFTQGFLLSRQTIAQTATQRSFDRSQLNVTKVLLVVIDALRYDFVSRVELSAVGNLIERHPHNCLLVKTIADPPTTTLQRLKGITTGSLPTFIDAGANFANGYVNEDNLIGQMKSAGKNVTFLGDDTWMSLFPSHFHRSYPFPSFDIKDLDTVDNGILRHLESEVVRSDWQLLIAHFLGVDHCGHRYGPNHVEMSRKLTQTNDVVRNLSELITPDTVLMVIGDHGMTETGDHGGDSGQEVSTTMFLFGKNLQFSGEAVQLDPLPQISIVPTLAYLLDIPIPFSNIGSIITQLFNDEQALTAAFKSNAQQIYGYLNAYTEVSSDLAIVGELKRLAEDYIKLTALQTAKGWESWMNDCRITLNRFWAKFDNAKMLLGIASFAENLFFTVSQIGACSSALILASRLVVSAVILAVCLVGPQMMLLPIAGGMLAISSLLTGFQLSKSIPSGSDFETLATMVVTFLWFATSFSNSFVVAEDRVAHFLLQSVFVAICFKLLVQKISLKKDKTKYSLKASKQATFSLLDLFSLKFRPYLYITLVMAVQRTLWVFRRCREEDFNCSVTLFTSNWHSLVPVDRLFRFMVSSLSLLLLFVLPRRLLSKNGNLGGKSLYELSLGRLIPIALVFAAVYWMIESNDGGSESVATAQGSLVRQQLLVLAWFVYGIVLIGLAAFVIFPTCVTSVSDDSVRSRVSALASAVSSEEDLLARVPVLFNLLRRNWNSIDADRQNQIFVFGLATGYSSSIVGFVCLMTVPLVLLLGDGMALSVLSFYVSAALLLEIQHRACISISSICGLWYLLSRRCFYAFGHQPTFATIPWHAAFVGLPGNFPYPIGPAVLVVANVFASDILFALSLPLWHFWSKYTGKTGCLSVVKCVDVKDPSRTEATLIATDVPQDVAQWLLGYLSFSGVKLLSTLLTSAHLRRHLMVWKIFGPKFVFDAVGFVVTSVALLVGLLVVRHIHRQISKDFGTLKVHSNQQVTTQ